MMQSLFHSKIGAFLQYFSKYCYVLEDDLGICGYVVAADNIKSYRGHLEKTWLPEMRIKYPIIDTSSNCWIFISKASNHHHILIDLMTRTEDTYTSRDECTFEVTRFLCNF